MLTVFHLCFAVTIFRIVGVHRSIACSLGSKVMAARISWLHLISAVKAPVALPRSLITSAMLVFDWFLAWQGVWSHLCMLIWHIRLFHDVPAQVPFPDCKIAKCLLISGASLLVIPVVLAFIKILSKQQRAAHPERGKLCKTAVLIFLEQIFSDINDLQEYTHVTCKFLNTYFFRSLGSGA